MLTELQKELLKQQGFSFENMEEIIFYLEPIITTLYTHNKNYTKQQYERIQICFDILHSLYGGI